MAKIFKIAPRSDNAKQVRRELAASIKTHTAHHGDNLAGFSIVSWDQTGSCAASILPGGLVSMGLAPTLCHDALNRYVSAERAREIVEGADVFAPNN